MSNIRQKIWRLVGTGKEHKESFLIAVSMLAVTGLYEYISSRFIPGYSLNIYEFVGTWSGLVCVWLSRTQNLLCWPWGILSSLALGVFFQQIALPGQQWLNLGYFVIIQLYAWPYWVFGGAEKQELPVTTLSWPNRFFTLAVIVAGTAVVYRVIDVFAPGSFHPILDSLVVSASVVAQFLLGRKKLENWILWLGPVNMVSIYLFFTVGAYTLTVLYVAFFIHAYFALRSWQKEKIIH